MCLNILKFLLPTILIFLKAEIKAKNLECSYRSSNFPIANHSYYSCYINTRYEYIDDPDNQIDGRHGSNLTDNNVKYLFIYDSNKPTTLNPIFCQKFSHLAIIRALNVGIDTIDEDSLLNCRNLEIFWLQSAQIEELPEFLLIRNLKLSRFWLQNSKLTKLNENFFLNQKQLEDLNLRDNQISSLPENIFRPLKKLKILQLVNNRLQIINPDWFVNLQNLKLLNFGGNRFSDVPQNVFKPLQNLKSLFLHENRIKTMNSDSFNNLQNLTDLALFDNEIADISPNVFVPLVNLEELDLYDNKLSTIHSDSFGLHPKLTEVYFQNNQISSIDEEFIDTTELFTVNMTNNICSQSILEDKTTDEIKKDLRKCFANYKPRFILETKIDTSSCGRSKAAKGNVIGGKEIAVGSYPWIAALTTPKGKYFCGGTLVSNRKVVTAAHCIQEKRSTTRFIKRDIIVLLGIHNLNNPIEIGRLSLALYSINMHDDWNPFTSSFDADIAVLVLEKEVQYNEHIQPICLTPPRSSITSLNEGFVVGYGKSEDTTKLHENIPKILKMPIQSDQQCFANDSGLSYISTGRTFCGGSGKGVGVCVGDSGSGFVVSDGSVHYLRGVVSSSLLNAMKECDVDNFAIFTDVAKYVRWINEIPISN